MREICVTLCALRPRIRVWPGPLPPTTLWSLHLRMSSTLPKSLIPESTTPPPVRKIRTAPDAPSKKGAKALHEDTTQEDADARVPPPEDDAEEDADARVPPPEDDAKEDADAGAPPAKARTQEDAADLGASEGVVDNDDGSKDIHVTMNDLYKMKKKDLQILCEERDICSTGVKNDLIDRLQGCVHGP